MIEQRFFKLMWGVDDDYERLLFAELVEPCEVAHNLPRFSSVPPVWPDNVTFELYGDGIEDIPSELSGWFLVSEKLRRLIDNSGLSGVTFFPVRTIWRSMQGPAPRYWYAHLKHIQSAIDFSNSVYKYLDIPRRPLTMVKFAFNHAEVDGWDFFRAAESPSAAFCSFRFRDLFLRNNCTGIGFLPVRVS